MFALLALSLSFSSLFLFLIITDKGVEQQLNEAAK
jgi:hypothetical protein